MEASSWLDDWRDRGGGGPGPGWLVAVTIPSALSSENAAAVGEGRTQRGATMVQCW